MERIVGEEELFWEIEGSNNPSLIVTHCFQAILGPFSCKTHMSKVHWQGS